MARQVPSLPLSQVLNTDSNNKIQNELSDSYRIFFEELIEFLREQHPVLDNDFT